MRAAKCRGRGASHVWGHCRNLVLDVRDGVGSVFLDSLDRSCGAERQLATVSLHIPWDNGRGQARTHSVWPLKAVTSPSMSGCCRPLGGGCRPVRGR